MTRKVPRKGITVSIQLKRLSTIYNRWAASYDAEIAENNYATPGRIADALWSVLPDDYGTALLDFRAVGQGLSGIALRRVGYEVVDGIDPSQEMLNVARSKGAHRNLIADLIPTLQRRRSNRASTKLIVACGVLGTGAAPASEVWTFDAWVEPGGDLLAFSLNDHALADPSYIGATNEWLDCGRPGCYSRNTARTYRGST